MMSEAAAAATAGEQKVGCEGAAPATAAKQNVGSQEAAPATAAKQKIGSEEAAGATATKQKAAPAAKPKVRNTRYVESQYDAMMAQDDIAQHLFENESPKVHEDAQMNVVQRVLELSECYPAPLLVETFVRVLGEYASSLERIESNVRDKTRVMEKSFIRAVGFIRKIQKELFLRLGEEIPPEEHHTLVWLVKELGRCHGDPTTLQWDLASAVSEGLKILEGQDMETASSLEKELKKTSGREIWKRSLYRVPMDLEVTWEPGTTDWAINALKSDRVWVPARSASDGKGFVKLTKAQLMKLSTKRGVRMFKSWSKVRMVDALQRHQEQLAPETTENSKLEVPRTERTILLGNLPAGITEEEVMQTLEPCGKVRSIEISFASESASRRRPRLPKIKKKKKAKSTNLQDENKKMTENFAIVEFEDEKGAETATRPAVKLFGILTPEFDLYGKPVGRASYPQDVTLKRCLVVKHKMSLAPQALLEMLARTLGEVPGVRPMPGSPCKLTVMNSEHIRNLPIGIGRISTQVCSLGSVKHVPELDEKGKTGRLNDGFSVLRFSSFRTAYLARLWLHAHSRAQREKVTCNFFPFRPMFTRRGPQGERLEQGRFEEIRVGQRGLMYTAQ